MKKPPFLLLSVFFILLCASFDFAVTGEDTHVHWLWEGRIEIPIILGTLSVLCFGMYLYLRGRERIDVGI